MLILIPNLHIHIEVRSCKPNKGKSAIIKSKYRHSIRSHQNRKPQNLFPGNKMNRILNDSGLFSFQTSSKLFENLARPLTKKCFFFLAGLQESSYSELLPLSKTILLIKSLIDTSTCLRNTFFASLLCSC